MGDHVTVIVRADWSSGRMIDGSDYFPDGIEWYRIPGNGANPIQLGTARHESKPILMILRCYKAI
jgi:hypothetical protein